ncbi:O-antigen/teichoic acid export membrane protein [Pseudomonas sp. BIGb0408]|uniref:O-antigen/teichoic acid export membrane protein n=1 Tax=Phytopseudomonas flavescens TaxID=29435 RepID=A0A7Z0BPW5_9GAMM|nr:MULTISPECIES: oligosaccharide flippase family protein [Pseudomonas]MCW2292119.1 O-antigen/teichoic acid export membrane protein [Pseudomonas sp. BIGb0408]NYH73309.1 O-antigen/teichoic acid export membrane protein [Pseudomonas flavescens]
MKLNIFSQFNSIVARSIAVMFGGTVLAQGITFAVTPLLSRLFSPSDFGVLGAFVAILTILISFSSLKYEFAIPQVSTKKHSLELTVLCLYILFAMSLLVAVSLFLLWAFDFYHADAYFWLLPLAVFFAGSFQVATYYSIKEKDFYLLSKANVSRSSGQAVLQVLSGIFSLGGGALILSYVFSQALGSFEILYRALKGFKFPSFLRLLVLCRKYIRFPKFSASASTLNTAATNSLPFLIIYFWSVGEAGLFALTQRAMGVPMAFLGAAIANVYLAELPRILQRDPAEAKKFYIKSLRNLVLAGLPLIAVSTLILFYYAEFIFGGEWFGISALVIVLAPFFLGQFVASPLSQTLNVIGRQDVQLIWDLCRLIVVLGCLVACGIYQVGFSVSILIYSILMFFFYAVSVVVTLILIDRNSLEVK